MSNDYDTFFFSFCLIYLDAIVTSHGASGLCALQSVHRRIHPVLPCVFWCIFVPDIASLKILMLTSVDYMNLQCELSQGMRLNLIGPNLLP